MIFNGTEFTAVKYVYPGETEVQPGVLVHDIRDGNRDGDFIVGNGCQVPMNEHDAKFILFNETGMSCFHLRDGVYHIY